MALTMSLEEWESLSILIKAIQIERQRRKLFKSLASQTMVRTLSHSQKQIGSAIKRCLETIFTFQELQSSMKSHFLESVSTIMIHTNSFTVLALILNQLIIQDTLQSRPAVDPLTQYIQCTTRLTLSRYTIPSRFLCSIIMRPSIFERLSMKCTLMLFP